MREPLEIAKSQVRLQRQFNTPPEKVTVKQILNIYEDFKKIYLKYRMEVPSIVVHYDNLINRPEVVAKRLSNFIGREIDLSEISPKETWKHRRVAQ
jgi:hypothetical protein